MRLQPLEYERRPAQQQARFGIVVVVVIWAVRCVAVLILLTAITDLVVVAVDPGAGRAGVQARSLVTPEVRRHHAVVDTAVLLASAPVVWLMSPARLWSWRNRRITRRCSGPPRHEAAQ